MQPFLSVSQVSVLCIVYNVPAVFVLILLGDVLYIVVYIQNIFDIVPFHCQSCPAAVYFYIMNISYLYVHSLKCSGTICLNGFLGLKDYFIICLSGSSSFMTLAELNVLQTLLAHHHSLGVGEQHPHCTSSALVFLQSQTSAVLCCIASHCMT